MCILNRGPVDSFVIISVSKDRSQQMNLAYYTFLQESNLAGHMPNCLCVKSSLFATANVAMLSTHTIVLRAGAGAWRGSRVG